MIYTLTLNPSMDRFLYVDSVKPDDSNRVKKDIKYSGGKGIDLSRVVNELGGQTIAMGFLGGFAGLELEGRLINQGITTDFIKINGETRTNILIKNLKNNTQTSYNTKGPEIGAHNLAMLFEKIRNLKPLPNYFAIAGSIPDGINKNIYTQLILEIKKRNIPVALDADGDAFKRGIRALPNIIKPNIHEFERLIGKKTRNTSVLKKELKKLNCKGIETILLSMGAKGLIVSTKDDLFKVIPPKINPKSTIGSGDSTLGAFLLGLTKKKNIRESARMGVAAGAACALTPGTELVHKKDYLRLINKVKIKDNL